jgi:hypothetical protein
MAQKVTVDILSDLSDAPDAHGVTLSFDGSAIEIDLTEAEHGELRDALGVYFEKGRKAAGAVKRGRPKGSANKPASAPAAVEAGGSGLTKEQRQEVRAYAEANGHALAKRGRLPEVAISAWRMQNPELLAHLAA